MEEIARQLRELRKRWEELPRRVKLAIIAGGVILAVALVAVLVANSEPTMAVLFSNLSEDDQLRIVERLSTMGIPLRVDEATNTIVVPRDRVHEVRLRLASEGLPSGPGVGFEVFDQQRFGESEFSEQVKYHRALEGELGRTISHLSGVRRARVHLVLPKRSLFVNGSQAASASVVLHLRPGWRVRDEQARGIVHLVASSVRSLSPERVTLVDGEGRRLGSGEADESELAADALAFRRRVEREKEQAVQQLLDATLGPGRSVVRIAAEVDFTREERTEETYDPQGVAPRSYQIVEEGPGAAGPTVGGVPGTPSNLPGGQAPESGQANNGGLAKRSETRNFEVSKVLRHSVEPVGRVAGLQVAVVVDGKWVGEGEDRTFEPLPRQEIDKIRGVVASAVGIDEKRGDRVTVESVPFAAVPAYEPSWLEKLLGPYLDLLPLAVGLLVLAAAVLVVRRRKKKAQQVAAGLPPPAAGGALPEPGSAEAVRQRIRDISGKDISEKEPVGQGLPAGDSGQEASRLSAEKMEEIRLLASELAGQEPEAAARVIRSWLAETTP